MILEDLLGIKLFERTTRGAEPTATGRGFIETARRIITDIENLQTTARAVSYGEEGRLSIGYGNSILAGRLKQVFTDYWTRYPEVQFDGIEGNPDKLINGLLSQSIDVVIAPVGIEAPGIKSLNLWSERLMAVFHEGHHLQGSERIYWHDLRREVIVIPTTGVGPIIGDRLIAKLTEQGFRPNIILQDVSAESIVSMATVGRFITVTTEASRANQWSGLHFRDIHEAGGFARLEYALYWRGDNENPALKRFLDLVSEGLPG